MAFNPLEPVKYRPPEPTESMSSLQPLRKQGVTKWLIRILALLMLGGVSLLAYQQIVKQRQQANLRMAVVPLERTNFSITVSANGTVEPESVVNVSPKAAGIMKSLLVKEGDAVRKGQVLARMDDSNLQGQLTQERGRLAEAQANLRKLIAGNRPQDIAQAQARLKSNQALLNKAEDDWSRNQQLQAAGAISLQTLNQKRADRDSFRAQVAEAQQALDLLQVGSRQEDIDKAHAEVLTARGSLQNIQTQVEDTLIRAPFDGVILRKYADPGAFVTPMTSGSSVSSATSSSLLALADNNQVVANVSESSIAQIRLNQPVTIKADAYPGKTFQGRVSQIATQATVEQNVTSFQVEVALVANAKKLLRSGMNASAEFQVGQLQNAIAVPTVAVTRQQNVTGVMVANPGHPPRFTPITTGATVNNRTEVKSGLNGTEMVLLSKPPKPQNQGGFAFPNLLGNSAQDGPQGGPPPGGPPGGGRPPGGGGPPG